MVAAGRATILPQGPLKAFRGSKIVCGVVQRKNLLQLSPPIGQLDSEDPIEF